MRNKKLFISISITAVFLLIVYLSTTIFNDRRILDNKTSPKVYSSSLAMMLETNYESGEYQETTDTSWADAIANGYTYNAELSKCENGSTLTWDETNQTVVFTGDVSDKCYVYFDIKPTETLSDHIISLYTADGENGLYYHDGVGTYGEYEAGDNSYRYSGANPNNYVCFGTDEETCPTDSLYRIIGVFDGGVKLIKYDYATSDALGTNGAYYGTGTPNSSYYKGNLSTVYYYYWNNDTSTNIWSKSNLNTVNLNTNYWSSLGTAWQNYIDDTSWIVGGNDQLNIYNVTNAKTNYINEITSPVASTTYSAKIGLMYVSEYRYAADPTQADAWSAVSAYNYSNSIVTVNNWMYMGDVEWTILPVASGTYAVSESNLAFYTADTGRVHVWSVYSCGYSVRPSFSLKSSVVLAGGTGTVSDPYRIAD